MSSNHYEEYVLILPDGSHVSEIVDSELPVVSQLAAFMEMHGASVAMPAAKYWAQQAERAKQ